MPGIAVSSKELGCTADRRGAVRPNAVFSSGPFRCGTIRASWVMHATYRASE